MITPLVTVPGVAYRGEPWQVHTNDLRPMALSLQADAAGALEAGDKDRYRKLETIAERLYDIADGYRVRPLAGSLPDNSRQCEECGKGFLSSRSSAKFCSKKCRQKATYYRAAA